MFFGDDILLNDLWRMFQIKGKEAERGKESK